MTLSPRTFDESMTFAQRQHASGTDEWLGLCQKFTRSGWGIGPLFGSAAAQWHGADPEDRFPGTDPDKAPIGSALCFLGGSRGFGHIMPTSRDFPSGRPGAWSNDLVRAGRIDKVRRTAPVTAWGHRYVGYILAVNDVDLRAPQRRRYPRLGSAIERLGLAHDDLEHARAQAAARSDAADVTAITAEIRAINAEINRLKTAYDTLRRT